MDAYVVQRKFVTDNHLRDLELATALMKFIQERPERDKHWSCHEICRAFIRQPTSARWEVQDGYFGQTGYRHCWLWGFTDGEDKRQTVILDIYPVAAVSPQLVVAFASPWDALYMDKARAYSSDDMHKFVLGSEKIHEQLRDDTIWRGIKQQVTNMRFAP